MARGDIYGGDPLAGPHRGPHHLPPVPQLSPAPLGLCQGAVVPQEEGLGTANNGPLQPQPQVAGDAETPGVGQPVALGQQELRLTLQPFQGSQDEGELPEGQEARDVGKEGLSLTTFSSTISSWG